MRMTNEGTFLRYFKSISLRVSGITRGAQLSLGIFYFEIMDYFKQYTDIHTMGGG